MKTILLIAAMMLAATAGRADPLDPFAGMSKFGETKEEYDARMSDDPRKIEAARARKAQEERAAASSGRRTIRFNVRTTWGP